MRAAAEMPPLSHWRKGEPFDIMHSKAAEWLSQQPEIRQHIWNLAKRDGAIILDLEHHCWRGVNWRV
jgi:hypothetical protein